MNKSSATKLIVLLLLSFFSFSCGDGGGNSEDKGNHPPLSDTNEARLMKALAGLSFVNEANTKCTLDFTADGKVIVNKDAPYSDPKEFVKKFWEYGKITVDNFTLDKENDGRWSLIIDSEEKAEVIYVDDINDITLLENYYGYNKPDYSGINDPALYSLTVKENLEFGDVDVSDDGKTYSGEMLLPCFDFYTPTQYYKIEYKGTEYETSRLNTDYKYQLDFFEIKRYYRNFEFNTETKQLYVAYDDRDWLNKRLEKWSEGNDYSFANEGYGYPCDFIRARFKYSTFDIKDGSPAYYRLASSSSHFGGDSGGGNNDPSDSEATLSGEYSVIGSSANVMLTFSNGTMTKKAVGGTGTAASYTYKINGEKLTITQISGGNNITNDFTLSKSNGNVVISGEKTFVFMIFGVNAENVTLTRN